MERKRRTPSFAGCAGRRATDLASAYWLETVRASGSRLRPWLKGHRAPEVTGSFVTQPIRATTGGRPARSARAEHTRDHELVRHANQHLRPARLRLPEVTPNVPAQPIRTPNRAASVAAPCATRQSAPEAGETPPPQVTPDFPARPNRRLNRSAGQRLARHANQHRRPARLRPPRSHSTSLPGQTALRTESHAAKAARLNPGRRATPQQAPQASASRRFGRRSRFRDRSSRRREGRRWRSPSEALRGSGRPRRASSSGRRG